MRLKLVAGRSILPNTVLLYSNGELKIARTYSSYNYLAFYVDGNKLYLMLYKTEKDVPPSIRKAVRKIYWRPDLLYGTAKVARLLPSIKSLIPFKNRVAKAYLKEVEGCDGRKLFELKFIFL